jgi:NAD(P)H-flavin reductase
MFSRTSNLKWKMEALCWPSIMIKATVQEAKGKMIKDSLNGTDPKLQKHVWQRRYWWADDHAWNVGAPWWPDIVQRNNISAAWPIKFDWKAHHVVRKTSLHWLVVVHVLVGIKNMKTKSSQRNQDTLRIISNVT